MALFTGLYLGLWCEHSVETNMVVAAQLGQVIPVVKSLRPFVSEFLKNRDMVLCGKLHLSSWSYLICNHRLITYNNKISSFSVVVVQGILT